MVPSTRSGQDNQECNSIAHPTKQSPKPMGGEQTAGDDVMWKCWGGATGGRAIMGAAIVGGGRVVVTEMWDLAHSQTVLETMPTLVTLVVYLMYFRRIDFLIGLNLTSSMHSF
jgi:hypothetical protein